MGGHFTIDGMYFLLKNDSLHYLLLIYVDFNKVDTFGQARKVKLCLLVGWDILYFDRLANQVDNFYFERLRKLTIDIQEEYACCGIRIDGRFDSNVIVLSKWGVGKRSGSQCWQG